MKEKSMSEKLDVYQIITDRIVTQLENGVCPWKKPWAVAGMPPQNLVSKKPYRGVNVFLLSAVGYASPYWLTFNQCKELGGTVRRGEKSCPVVFWKWLDIEDKETKEKSKIPFLRYYSVFNSSQCDGLKVPETTAKNDNSPIQTAQPIQTAEQIVASMPNRPEIIHGQCAAYYRPSTDQVGMPDMATFNSAQEYYSTLFHELTHSTGAEKRCARKDFANSFGTDLYGREELVAEMGAAFLCGHAGILQATEKNSAAYLAAWLDRIKQDKKLVVVAAGQAQKAADYILNNKPETVTIPLDNVPVDTVPLDNLSKCDKLAA